MEIKHIEDKGFFISNEKEEVIAELTYRKEGNKLYFDHTYVSRLMRGQGIAEKLLDAGVEYAEKNEGGMLFSGNNFKVVKKVLKSGEAIPSHNHENEEIIFSVLKGKMEMYLNDTEKHVLVPGDILNFDGVNFIKGTALEDSEVNVTLVKK